jgi:molybdopterin converting factor small subunit
MGIHVEFFGVARQRAGTATAVVPVEGTVTLGSLLDRLAVEFPHWASECLEGNRLRPGYIVNVNGDRFVRDVQEPLEDEASLLIMSADAGG